MEKAWCLLVNLDKEGFSKKADICLSVESKVDRDEVQFGISEDTGGKQLQDVFPYYLLTRPQMTVTALHSVIPDHFSIKVRIDDSNSLQFSPVVETGTVLSAANLQGRFQELWGPQAEGAHPPTNTMNFHSPNDKNN